MDALAAMTRSWPMLGALGAGLVLTALAAGAGGAPQVALVGLGLAALGWGVLSLRADRMLVPRAVLGVAVAALLAGGAAATAGAWADVAALPLAAASVFIAAVALAAAIAVRGARARPTAGPPTSEAAAAGRPSPARDARRTLVGLALGAALVSALATPALAATDAGELAVPHGRHGPHDPGHSH